MPPATALAFSQFREGRILKAKQAGVYYPSCCPTCGHQGVLRAGWSRGCQRYRCASCRRTFGDNSVVREPFVLMCHRCGSIDCASSGKAVRGGRKALCRACRRYFVQGGTEEIDRHSLILKARIALLKLPPNVAAELFQQATVEVLEGRGYCWTIRLDVGAAWTSERGSWMGSGSGGFLKAVGERARSDC